MIRKITEETEVHHRHRGRRHGDDRLEQRRERPEGRSTWIRWADPRGRGRRDLHGQGHAHDAVRRVRRDPAGQGRPGPHLGAGELSRADASRTWSTSATRSQVLVTEIDRQGRINLSRRALLDPVEGEEAPVGVGAGGEGEEGGTARRAGPRPGRPGRSAARRASAGLAAASTAAAATVAATVATAARDPSGPPRGPGGPRGGYGGGPDRGPRGGGPGGPSRGGYGGGEPRGPEPGGNPD